MWRPWPAILIALAACGYPDLPPLADAAGTDGVAGQSCADLARTCGPSGTSGTDDCCATAIPIPGGSFFHRYDAAADAFNDMNEPATVSPFVLGKYEVTVGRFRRFVNADRGTGRRPPSAGAGAHPHLAGSGWDPTWDASLRPDRSALEIALKGCGASTWTDAPGTNESKPITCVSWYEAMAFCVWDGGYLPTDAEWSFAAAGGDEQRAFPWSPTGSPGTTTLDCQHANYKIDDTMFCGGGMTVTTGAVTDVGRLPMGDGKWGHSDLGGDVDEWLLDAVGPFPAPCVDCAVLASDPKRVIRGGAFSTPGFALRGANGTSTTATGRFQETGFRCARTP